MEGKKLYTTIEKDINSLLKGENNKEIFFNYFKEMLEMNKKNCYLSKLNKEITKYYITISILLHNTTEEHILRYKKQSTLVMELFEEDFKNEQDYLNACSQHKMEYDVLNYYLENL